MSILITGGCGFIGLNLARELLERDKEIVLFDVLPEEVIPDDIKARVTYVRGDITIWTEVLNAVKDHQVEDVFHLAATLSAPSEGNPWRAYKINAEGTYNALEASRLFGVRKFIFSSSMGVYGSADVEVISDSTIQQPTIIYGVTKVFGELLGRYYHKRFGIDFRGVRIPQLVGAGVRSGGFGQYNPGMIQAAAAGKPYEIWVPEDTVLPLLYIKDAVRSLVLLYEADESAVRTRVYNLGQITPSPTAGELADIVKKYVPGAQLTFKPDPVAVEVIKSVPKKIDGSNAEKEWGWKILYSAEDSVRDFLEELGYSPDRAM